MYGILVKNNSNQILISSEVVSLHCGGKAIYTGTLLSGLNDFPAYSGDDGRITLSGRHVHRYRFTSMDAPLFFIKPRNSSCFHGVLQQFQSGMNWYVDVIQSGRVSQPPDIYAFVPPRNLPVPQEGYGIAAYTSAGQTTFDSRLMPLAVYHAQSAVPPTLPCDGGIPTAQSGFAWNDTTLDFNFKCNSTYNTYALPTTIDYNNLMFSAPSIAQAVYTRQKNGYKNSSGYSSSQQHWSTAIWWAMYHSAYRITYGSIHAGWSVYAADYRFSSTWEGTSFLDFGGSGGSVQTGNRPFNDKTINLSHNLVIVADASVYS